MFELELLTADGVGPRLRVGGRVLFIGRGSQCDLVLLDEAVSTRHLAVWHGEGGLFVEDLRSRNGTRVNGEALLGRTRVGDQALIELGASTRLRVRATAPQDLHAPQELPLVEDVVSGARFPVRRDRFVFGASPSADVYLPDVQTAATILLVVATGEVWLGSDAEDRVILPDEEFVIGGRRFCLRLPTRPGASTRELTSVDYPYDLLVTLDGPTGPQALFTHLDTAATVEVHGETRAVLLYVLARRAHADACAGVPAFERGWVRETDAVQGVWGRAGVSNANAALNVLVWRIRKDLEAGGFDPWCVEKRQRALRLRVASVQIADQKPAPRSP